MGFGVGFGTSALLVLSLLFIAFFLFRKRRSASRKKRVAGVSHPPALLGDSNDSSTITVQELDDNGRCGHKELADTAIIELPCFSSVSEFTGSDPSLGQMSTSIPVLDVVRASPPIPQSKRAHFPSDKQKPARSSGRQGTASTPFVDLNRPLPSIPPSERVLSL